MYSQHLQNFEINMSGFNAFRRYNPMVQEEDASIWADRGTISAAKVASNGRWYPSSNKVISILFALQEGPVSQSREKEQENQMALFPKLKSKSRSVQQILAENVQGVSRQEIISSLRPV